MPLMPGLGYILGESKHALWPSEGVSVDARRECGGGGVEQAAKSVKTEQELHACR